MKSTHPGEYFLLVMPSHKIYRLACDMESEAPEGSVVITRFNQYKERHRFNGVLPFWETVTDKLEIFDMEGRLHPTFQTLPRWSRHA